MRELADPPTAKTTIRALAKLCPSSLDVACQVLIRMLAGSSLRSSARSQPSCTNVSRPTGRTSEIVACRSTLGAVVLAPDVRTEEIREAEEFFASPEVTLEQDLERRDLRDDLPSRPAATSTAEARPARSFARAAGQSDQGGTGRNGDALRSGGWHAVSRAELANAQALR